MAARSVNQPRQARPDLSVFLVERYLGPTAALELTASVARLARLARTSSASTGGRPEPDGQVRYLQSMYLPSEDTCFCLFGAPTAEAVLALNEVAGFPLDRITPAVLLLSHELRSAGGTAGSGTTALVDHAERAGTARVAPDDTKPTSTASGG